MLGICVKKDSGYTGVSAASGETRGVYQPQISGVLVYLANTPPCQISQLSSYDSFQGYQRMFVSIQKLSQTI